MNDKNTKNKLLSADSKPKNEGNALPDTHLLLARYGMFTLLHLPFNENGFSRGEATIETYLLFRRKGG